MKRLMTVFVAAAVLASLMAGLAGARSGPALQLRKTSAGTILVNDRGFTVYAYTADGRNKDACARESGCLTVWPAVTSASRPVLGRGVRASLVGRIRLKGGAEQLTYAGHPLYIYVGDSHPGETSNIDIFQFKGRWPALNAAGREVK